MMKLVPIRDIGRKGFIADEASSDIAPNAIDIGRHLRVRDGRLQNGGGFLTSEDTSSFAGNPVFGVPLLRSTGASRVVFFSDGTVRQYAGGNWTDISPTVAFTAGGTWSVIQYGDHLVATNFLDAVHSFGPSDARFIPLPGWPSNWRCKALAETGGHLLALGTQEAGTNYLARVRWTDPVEPAATLTTDWDETSTDNLAGLATVSEGQGDILSGLKMGAGVVIYSRFGATYARYVAGRRVFDFRPLPHGDQGVINQRCAVDIDGTHILATRNGVYAHEGGRPRPLSDRRVTRLFQAAMKNEAAVFLFAHRKEKEVWLCYGTQSGTAYADKALVWNYQYDTWTPLDLPTASGVPAISHAFEAPEEFDITTWAELETAGLTWNELDVRWDELEEQPGQLVPYVVSPSLDRIFRADIGGPTVDGAPMESMFQQSQLDLDEVVGATAPIKYLDGLYPIVRGSAVLEVRVGGIMLPGGGIYWETPQSFTPNVDRRVDTRSCGQLFAIRVRSTAGGTFDLSGWDLEVSIDSER